MVPDVHACLCTQVSMDTQIYAHTGLCTRVSMCMWVFVHTDLCTQVCVHMCVCLERAPSLFLFIFIMVKYTENLLL